MPWASFKVGLFTFTLAFTFFTVVNAESSSVSVTIIIPECNDTLDNDADLLVDYPLDTGCSSLADNDETNPVVVYECNDGLDNDSDSRTDYPADLGCDSVVDSTEYGEIVSSAGGNGPVLSGLAPQSGTQLVFLGTAFKGATITVLADGVFAGSARALDNGSFVVKIAEFPPGVYIFNIYATDVLGRSTRPYSYALDIIRGLTTQISGIKFTQPESDILPNACAKKGDLNSDCSVDLEDFSIAAYWWSQELSVAFSKVEIDQLNGDGTITLEDFSILAYHWTG